jgi:hypothetical protein
MNVIFLDIDGVMNSHVFYEKRHKMRWIKPITYWWLLRSTFRKIFRIKSKPVSLADYKIPDKYYKFENQYDRLREETCSQKWKWLSEFCNETGTKICISSVWKYHFTDKNGESNLENWNEALIRIGFNPDTFVGVTGDRRTLRGQEIKEWMDEFPEVIEDYAILDDDRDMLEEQMGNFHHSDPWFGMSPNHLYRIQRQFEGKRTRIKTR